MKKYINRDKFENITSWEQAAKVFNGITESDRKPFRIDYFHSFKEFYYMKKYYMVSYDVSFIKTLFGCRVDKIKIEVGPHPCK
jgi:hypothetical protein